MPEVTAPKPQSKQIIKDLPHLIKLSSIEDEPLECFIMLAGRAIRSSKRIEYYTDTKDFHIINEIDDSCQNLTAKELYTKSNIGEAINKHALITY